MEARLNKGFGALSAGTRVTILNPLPEDDDALIMVELVTPSKKLLDIEPGAGYPFDVEVEYLTYCRSMTELIPSQNRHKRRMVKRANYALAKEAEKG